MKIIKVHPNKEAKVDDEDFEFLNQRKWKLNHRGYAVRTSMVEGKYRIVRMHRVVLKVNSTLQVDHINGDKLDNRKSNLRLCNATENRRNVQKYANNKSGYKGVYWNKNAWQAKIRVDKENIYLGRYPDKKEAAEAYNQAAVRYFGEFAKPNLFEV